MPPRKKSGKSKERKLKRKQEQAETAQSLGKVSEAYEVEDYMALLPAFQKYTRNGLDVTVSFQRVADVSEEDKKWAFELMKNSVKDFYMSGGWGWNDRDKMQELTHDAACFLLARDSSSQSPVGFLNFRFDLDDNIEVVYCYEVHLQEQVRRRGLGKFLLQILELIGHRAKMKKIVLTVFKENTASSSFFTKKLNFVEDETSPSHCDPLHSEEYSYLILSKALVRPVKLAAPEKQVFSVVGSNDGTSQSMAVASATKASAAKPQVVGCQRPAAQELASPDPTLIDEQ